MNKKIVYKIFREGGLYYVSQQWYDSIKNRHTRIITICYEKHIAVLVKKMLEKKNFKVIQGQYDLR